MALTKMQLIIIVGIAATVTVATVVGVTVGVVVGRKSSSVDFQQRTLQILDEHPLIDGHNDWAWLIRSNFQNKIEKLNMDDMLVYNLKNSTPSHTDINRLRKGKVGGQFWSIYSSCAHQGRDAAISFLEQIDLMNRLLMKRPDVFQRAGTAAEVRAAFKEKKIASLYGIEGGQAIENSFGLLRLFYQLGVRYMTLTHNCDTPWAVQNQADGNPSGLGTNGLSTFGRKLIGEMNRLGMIVDLSHVAKQTMIDALDATKSPVMFSHSSAWALCNHTRNVQDDVLKRVAINKGVVMVTFVPSFISCNQSDPATLAHVAKHIEHIRVTAGIDNVGLAGDYDGISSTITGLEDTSTYPALIEHLIAQYGWKDEWIIKLIGENILRVLEDNERIAQVLQKESQPEESLIDKKDLEDHGQTECRHLDMYS